ncbi:shikimate kinase [Desulfitibacter alkalitolerans]|uniref:shikimate kinase n=1 Tax=Desulfitibacter alkalitolerans TaxID=264641 RepID=UPI00048930C5|nr:shikimate kinase [Desulfitibacter alkalitolerans]
MNNNIVLIGFMGSGKTAVGKRLANKLKMGFFDTDENIEKVSGMSIGKIFNDYGEIRFRSEETLAVKRACALNNSVIATGGGAVLIPENLELLKKSGVIVALDASPEEIQKRVSKRNSFRPLLGNDKSLENITRLLKKRVPVYQQANYRVDTTGKELETVVDEIMELLKNNE